MALAPALPGYDLPSPATTSASGEYLREKKGEISRRGLRS
jgi:hypothetical protein